MASKIRQVLDGILTVGNGIAQIGEVLGGGDPRLDRANVIDVELPGRPGEIQVRKHRVDTLDQRLAHIIEMTHKGREDGEIRRFTVEAVSKRCGDTWCTPEHNARAEVRAVWDALKRRYRYVHDTAGADLFQHPLRTLEFGGGDCDDAAILVASCLGSIGYPMRFRVVHTKNARTWNHIYPLVGLPKQRPRHWIALDLTVPHEPGWQPPRRTVRRYRDFDV